MLNTVKPVTFTGQRKPDGFFARKADKLVDRVEVFARQAHIAMDEIRVPGGHFDVKA